MDQKFIDLFDRYTHGGMNRRDFLEKLSLLAGSSAAALTLLPALENNYLITHELQPVLAGDMALEGFVPRPKRGAGSWRRDRISG